MTMLPDTLITLAESGASLRVDAKRLTHNQLHRLAAAVAESGATLAITNADSLTPQLAQALAAIAGKQISFDLVSL